MNCCATHKLESISAIDLKNVRSMFYILKITSPLIYFSPFYLIFCGLIYDIKAKTIAVLFRSENIIQNLYRMHEAVNIDLDFSLMPLPLQQRSILPLLWKTNMYPVLRHSIQEPATKCQALGKHGSTSQRHQLGC